MCPDAGSTFRTSLEGSTCYQWGCTTILSLLSRHHQRNHHPQLRLVLLWYQIIVIVRFTGNISRLIVKLLIGTVLSWVQLVKFRYEYSQYCRILALNVYLCLNINNNLIICFINTLPEWRAGRTAGSVRCAAISSLWALLRSDLLTSKQLKQVPVLPLQTS